MTLLPSLSLSKIYRYMYKLNKQTKQKKKNPLFFFSLNLFCFWKDFAKRTVRYCNEVKHTIKYHPVHGKDRSIHPNKYAYNNTDSLCWSRHLFLSNRLSLLLAEGISAWEFA